jgi:hypothetical protein
MAFDHQQLQLNLLKVTSSYFHVIMILTFIFKENIMGKGNKDNKDKAQNKEKKKLTTKEKKKIKDEKKTNKS